MYGPCNVINNYNLYLYQREIKLCENFRFENCRFVGEAIADLRRSKKIK